jgi:hypothetical protein
MPGLFAPAVSLAVLLSASALPQAGPTPTTAAKSDQPFNIGFVLYTKGKTPGTLDARWTYGNAYSGHGVATGGSATGDHPQPNVCNDRKLPLSLLTAFAFLQSFGCASVRLSGNIRTRLFRSFEISRERQRSPSVSPAAS